MKNSKSRLTTLDIKYINQILGRVPSNIELNFIKLVLSNELTNRSYLQVLNRLNVGTKRTDNKKYEINHEFNLHFHDGLEILDENHKTIFCSDNPIYRIDSKNSDMVLQNQTVFNKNFDDDKLIPDVKIGQRDYQKVLRIFNQSDENIIFSNFFELRKGISELKNLKNAQIFVIPFGKRYFKKYQALLQKAASNILSNEWVELFQPVSIQGLGKTLINLIKEFSLGIKLSNKFQCESLYNEFGPKDDLNALIIIKNGNIAKLEAFCKINELIYQKIGDFIDDKTIQIFSKTEPIINLPVDVFSLQLDVNAPHFPQSELKFSAAKLVSKSLTKSSLNNQFLKLYQIVSESDCTWSKKINRQRWENHQLNYGISSNGDNADYQIVISQADNNNLLSVTPRAAGQIAIASSTRKLSCLGIKPKYIVVNNIFPNSCDKSNWLASELMQGQEEAIRELDLNIGSRTIESFSNIFKQNVVAAGLTKNKLTLSRLESENIGDFITLLGSHRGELGHSSYEYRISGKLTEKFPTVDLRMENRLQSVVQQGINTKLIKAVANVGAGGVSITIAKLLANSEYGVGARIHLSRKLSEAELLFGETQGLIIVVISEIDIMEFERICMTIGVPSTTIGRITENNLFTFNDLIWVNADKFRAK